MIDDIGAYVYSIIIIMFLQLLLDLGLSNVLEIYWSPNANPLPLLCVSGPPLVSACGCDLMAVNL